MLDGAQADGGGDFACAFLADFLGALILKGLALGEGQGGAQELTGVVGVVAGGLLPQLSVGGIGDDGHFLAVEVEGHVAAVIIGLNEGIGAVGHEDHALVAVGIVNEGQGGIQLVGVVAHAGLGDAPAVGLHGTPGLGEAHVNAVLVSAVEPVGHGNHDSHVLLALVQHGGVVNGLGLVVVVVHEAQIILQVGLGALFGLVNEGLGDQALFGHGVHVFQSLVGGHFLTGVIEEAVFTHVQEILTGFQTADAEQDACEAEHVNTALVVVVLTGEQALDGIGAVEGLGVGNHAAQQGDQLVSVPGSVLTHEQVGAGGAVVAVVSGVDVGAEHIDGLHTGDGTGLVHQRNDVAGSIIVLGDGLHSGTLGVDHVDFHHALGGHIGLVDGLGGVAAGIGGEFTLAVQQLLHPVHTHQRHTLDVVDTVEVGGEIDGAGGGVAGDGQPDDGVGFQVGLEVGHLVQVLGDVHQSAGLAVLRKSGSGAGDHVHLVQAVFPVLEFLGGVVALILVLEGDAQNILDLHPGGLQVAGVVGVAVSQGDTLAGNLRIEEQAGLGVVVAGGHPQDGTLGIVQAGLSGSGAHEQGRNHCHCQQQSKQRFHVFHVFLLNSSKFDVNLNHETILPQHFFLLLMLMYFVQQIPL